MSGKSPDSKSTQTATEQRASAERRNRTLHALLQGNWTPRRRAGRRKTDAGFAAIDWHDSRWFAVALLIVILSCADAFFTVTLLADGAYEANPFMAALLDGSPHGFAGAKIGLTSVGVILLTVLARARAFGRVPVGLVLYAVLLGYATLVAYEYWLCDYHLLGP
jgi:hypothetical protein